MKIKKMCEMMKQQKKSRKKSFGQMSLFLFFLFGGEMLLLS
jgi:hypothetical protein